MKRNLSESLLNELIRHNQINKYITEQEVPVEEPPAGGETLPTEPTTPPPSDATLGGTTPPPTTAPTEPGQPIDVANDPDVEEISGDEDTTAPTETTEETGTEELDITELVNTQKDIQTKQEEYMTSMMSKLDDLEQKLSQMDGIFEKINSIEDKIEKYRAKTPEEKLELRSLDSYPFNQKLTDFFGEKSEDMEKTGKNEYILRSDDIEDVDSREVRKTFDQGLAQ